VVLFPLLLIPLYGVFRKAPKTWWIWGAGVGIVFLMFVMLIGPVYIDPLFNTYEALEDESIKEPILSMARANGIQVDNVYQFDASRQSNRVSANVSGFLGTMSIRLNDNLLSRCSLPEIETVMAHEMGHYVLNHVYETVIFFGFVLVLAFAFIRWGFEWVRQRWGDRWSVSGIGDLAGMPLLAALFAFFFFLFTPFLNTYIRVNEAEADIFALHAAGQPDGMAEVALKLGEYRKMEPGPLEEWLLFDHPSGRSRIHMAMTWKAEHLDEGDAPLE
jgi:STE24 endopeptidase